MAWFGQPSSLAKTGMRIAVKGLRNAQDSEWLLTLATQPKFDALNPWYALRKPPFQRNAAQCRHAHSGPIRRRRSALPNVVLAPPIRTCVTFSITKRSLLRKACTPEPSSFPQGRPMVSIIIMLEEGQPPILLIHSNTREILPHLSDPKLDSGLLPQHLHSMLHASETRQPQAPIPFGDRLLSSFCDLYTAYLSNRLSGKSRVHRARRPSPSPLPKDTQDIQHLYLPRPRYQAVPDTSSPKNSMRSVKTLRTH